MIAVLFAITVIAAAPKPSPPQAGAALPPAAVLARYKAALAKVEEPRVLSFDYTIDQRGTRSANQKHRVFRNRSDTRDETLMVEGHQLATPTVRIFHGRRNHYTVASLAPKPANYAFTFVASKHDGHHVDYIFRAIPKVPSAFSVERVTIDGVRFLPQAIAFTTSTAEGHGTITFGGIDRWWVVTSAAAHAVEKTLAASETLVFTNYRFPASLPPSTFTTPRPLPIFKPAP